MRVKKLPVFIVTFFVGSSFYFVSADYNQSTTQVSGSYTYFACATTSSYDCYLNQSTNNRVDYQTYKGNLTTTLDERFGNSTYLRVENCLTQWGWTYAVGISGNSADCRTTIDQNVGDFVPPASWSGSSEIDLGYLSDLNFLSVHVWVNNAYTHTDVTVEGRRVVINNFTAPTSVSIGQNFNVSWTSISNLVNNATFTYSGPISCNVFNGQQVSGFTGIFNVLCTGTGVGTAQVKLDAYGPGGSEPITVSESRDITVATTTHLECVSNACTNVSGSGSDLCSSDADCSGSCTPTTCAAQGKNCGSISDGCGRTLNCGPCTSPQTCGGGGTANVCGGGQTCNNGIKEGTEQCDNGSSNGTCPASCSTSCTTNSCGGGSFCGDGVRQCPNGARKCEDCDGADLNGRQCINVGYTGGFLGCYASSCDYNYSACTGAPAGTVSGDVFEDNNRDNSWDSSVEPPRANDPVQLLNESQGNALVKQTVTNNSGYYYFDWSGLLSGSVYKVSHPNPLGCWIADSGRGNITFGSTVGFSFALDCPFVGIPPPENPSGSCSGSLGQLTWTRPSGYNPPDGGNYINVQRTNPLPIVTLPINAVYDGTIPLKFVTEPGATYYFEIRTRKSSDGALSSPATGTFICTSACGGQDLGLRLHQGKKTEKIAIEPETGTTNPPLSLLRIYNRNVTRGVVLVDPSNPNASKMLVQTSGGLKALCLMP